MSELGNEVNKAKSAEVVEQVEEVEEVVEEVEETEESEETTDNGFKSYDEYIADGGDPDFYRGKKAFEQQKEIIAELKTWKSKTKQIDDFMFQQEKRHAKETERLLADIEKAKKEAKNELDFDKYEELERQRQDIQGVATEKHEGEAPVIADYRQSNPELNPAAPNFDPVYASAFAAAFNVAANQAEKQAGRPLTQSEIQMHLEATAKRLGNKPVEKQQRPSKVAANKGSGGGKKDVLSSMPPEQRAMYQRWLKDPNKKAYAETMIANYGEK